MSWPVVSTSLLACILCASSALAQTGPFQFGWTYTGYQQPGSLDGYLGTQGNIDYRPATGPYVLAAWGGIDNQKGGVQGDCHIQVGWYKHAGASEGLTYWEYAPDHGSFPDNLEQGFGPPAPLTAYYALEKTVDQFSHTVVWIGAADGMNGLFFISVPWEEFDGDFFCCAFFGIECHETNSTRAPGKWDDQCCFSSLEVKDRGTGTWGLFFGPLSQSYYVDLVGGGPGAFCVYDTRN